MNKEEQIYNQIRDSFIDIEINKKSSEYMNNKYDLSKYFRIGELIIEAQGGEEKAKYGNNVIKNISNKLIVELGKKYTTRYLEYIRKFYIFQKTKPVASQLSWSHYLELLSLKDDNEIVYYINKCINMNISRNKLRELIKTDEYHRLPVETRNKLINKEELSITDEFKNPLIINGKDLDPDKISEKALHSLIIKDLDNFLLQLGNDYSYVGHEYPIRLGNTNNYIDILLFNIKYNCYVVVELKVTELKKNHIGQIQVYMNYIDNNVKKINHDITIGLIVVRHNNEYIIRYSSDKRIKAIEWSI